MQRLRREVNQDFGRMSQAPTLLHQRRDTLACTIRRTWHAIKIRPAKHPSGAYTAVIKVPADERGAGVSRKRHRGAL